MKYIFFVILIIGLSSCDRNVDLQCSVDDIIDSCKKDCGDEDWKNIFIWNGFGLTTSATCTCKHKDIDLKGN